MDKKQNALWIFEQLSNDSKRFLLNMARMARVSEQGEIRYLLRIARKKCMKGQKGDSQSAED